MMKRFALLIGVIVMLPGCNATSNPKKPFDKKWEILWEISSPAEFKGDVMLWDVKIDCDDKAMIKDAFGDKMCKMDLTKTFDQYPDDYNDAGYRWEDADNSVIDVVTIWEDKVVFDDVDLYHKATPKKVKVTPIFGTASARADERVGQCHFNWNSTYLNNLRTGKQFTLESLPESPCKCKVTFGHVK